jgi:hypothetical protein
MLYCAALCGTARQRTVAARTVLRRTPRLPAVLEALLDGTLSWLSLLLLLLWSASKAAETGWRLIKEDPSLGGRLPGGGATGRIM